jgi:hypothetical protein
VTNPRRNPPARTFENVIYKILTHWGVEGFLANARNVALFYAGRKGWFEEIAHRHLDGGYRIGT